MQRSSHSNERSGSDSDSEYRAIEAALLDTPRGRWFLAEHGRRARRLDSAALAEAMQRLNASLRQPPALLGALQREIATLQEMIIEVRQSLLAKPAQPAAGDPALSTPQSILKAAEDLHELAWSLQANDIDPEGCEAIARNAWRIYALSQAQAAEGTRARQFAETLETAAARLTALLETIGHELEVDAGADAA